MALMRHPKNILENLQKNYQYLRQQSLQVF